MPSGLIALLDDVAMIAKLAASSMDDIGAAVGKAGTKAAGVVIDDTAVTPRYVTGLAPERELPIIGKIALGSIKNKLFILLPVAMLLAAFADWLITPLLMIGGAYLAFEASEKIWEKLSGDNHSENELMAADTPQELEERQVAGAIRTDFILSAEIMAIALNELEGNGLVMQGFSLAAVAIVITAAVYGSVGLIVKLDDIGLHLAQEKRNGISRTIGRGLVLGVPKLLTSLSVIGTAAMLWVGGQILLHGMDELGFDWLPHLVHDGAHAGALAIGFWVPAWEWLLNALGGAVAGIVVGAPIVGLLHLFKRKPEAAATEAAH